MFGYKTSGQAGIHNILFRGIVFDNRVKLKDVMIIITQQ